MLEDSWMNRLKWEGPWGQDGTLLEKGFIVFKLGYNQTPIEVYGAKKKGLEVIVIPKEG